MTFSLKFRNNSGMETEQKRTKRPYKLNPVIRQFIYQMLGEYYSLQQTANAVKKKFGIQIGKTSIDRIQKEFPEEAVPAIREARNKFNATIIDLPMSSRNWRIREILDMYLKATKPKDRYLRTKLLALGRAEIGENFDKIAEAIRNSGGDTVVNIITYSDEELKRAIRELAAVSTDSYTASRF